MRTRGRDWDRDSNLGIITVYKRGHQGAIKGPQRGYRPQRAEWFSTSLWIVGSTHADLQLLRTQRVIRSLSFWVSYNPIPFQRDVVLRNAFGEHAACSVQERSFKSLCTRGIRLSRVAEQSEEDVLNWMYSSHTLKEVLFLRLIINLSSQTRLLSFLCYLFPSAYFHQIRQAKSKAVWLVWIGARYYLHFPLGWSRHGKCQTMPT